MRNLVVSMGLMALVSMSFSAFSQELLVNCEDENQQIQLTKQNGKFILSSKDASGVTFNLQVNRKSLREFEGQDGDERVVFRQLDGQNFVIEIISQLRSSNILFPIQCEVIATPRPAFCESYEDFDECKDPRPDDDGL
jgi:hypothetical protein